MELSSEYYGHGQALENFRLALISAEATQEPIPFDVCLTAWASLVFAFEEIQAITERADARINELKAELATVHFERLPAASMA